MNTDNNASVLDPELVLEPLPITRAGLPALRERLAKAQGTYRRLSREHIKAVVEQGEAERRNAELRAMAEGDLKEAGVSREDWRHCLVLHPQMRESLGLLLTVQHKRRVAAANLDVAEKLIDVLRHMVRAAEYGE